MILWVAILFSTIGVICSLLAIVKACESEEPLDGAFFGGLLGIHVIILTLSILLLCRP